MISTRKQPRPIVCAAWLAISALPLLTGCALTSSGVPTSTINAQMAGVVHGGQSPIQGATVNLYVTRASATGYGQAATLIGSATTDVNGGFTIAPSASTANCPAGQQAYITAAGGYPSGSPTLVNNSSLLMATLGDCANVSASTRVVINEVTTVAAGYALSGFMTTSASGSLFAANVSAPAANSAATGTTTVAAGLPHAFLNAANLASSVSGSANATTANINAGGNTITGVVPTVEINTLADILQACVNGVTANSACTSLFSFTPSISGTVPTNTLQSMINLARNPYPSAAAMNATTGLISLTSGAPAFQPTLTATPPDWSMAIVYKSATFPASFYDLALDSNDTAYAGAGNAANLVAISPYGVSTPAFTAGATGTATRQLALDGLGNAWLTNFGGFVYQYNTQAGGSPASLSGFTQAWGVAVDKSSNVWVADAATTTPNIREFAYAAGAGSSPATYSLNYTATAPGGFEPVQLTIDASQNIWASDYYTGGSLAVVLPNLSAASATAAPTYATSGTVITPVSATFSSSATKPLGSVIDASGNAWYGITGSNSVTTTGIEEVIPSTTSSVITGLAPQPLVTGATLGAKASQIPGIDGAGVIYIPDNQGAGALGIHAYSTVPVSSSNTASQILSPPSGYLGCYLATSTTVSCGTGTSSAIYNPRQIAVDSTGSVWADISTTGGFTQVIGLAAPTWPLLSIGKPGLSPGLTAVNPLP